MSLALEMPSVEFLVRTREHLRGIYRNGRDTSNLAIPSIDLNRIDEKRRDKTIERASVRTEVVLTKLLSQIAAHYELSADYQKRFPNVEVTDKYVCGERSIFEMADVFFFPRTSFYAPVATGLFRPQPDGPNIAIFLPLEMNEARFRRFVRSSLVEESHHFLEDFFQTTEAEWAERPGYKDPLERTQKKGCEEPVEGLMRNAFAKRISNEAAAYFTVGLFSLAEPVREPVKNKLIPEQSNPRDLYMRFRAGPVNEFIEWFLNLHESPSFTHLYRRQGELIKLVQTFEHQFDDLVHYLGYSLGRSLTKRGVQMSRFSEAVFNPMRAEERLDRLIALAN